MASLALDKKTEFGVRALVTPEGVDLRVHLATAGERALALIIDLSIIVGSLIALTLATISAFFGGGFDDAGQVVQVIWLLAFSSCAISISLCSSAADAPPHRASG
jgi:uncharacterized RDD family membrane protein YckC